MQTKRKYSWGYLALAVVVCGVLLVLVGVLMATGLLGRFLTDLS